MTTLLGTVRLPRARRVRVGCVAVLVAVTAVATACGSSSKSTNSTNSTSTSTSVPKPTAQPASPDGVGSTDPALADPVGTLIIRDVPMEFSLQDDDLAGTGPTDLDKAAADAGFDGAKRFLEEAGFEREYQRCAALLFTARRDRASEDLHPGGVRGGRCAERDRCSWYRP